MALGVNIVPNDPSYETDCGIPYQADTPIIAGLDDSSQFYEEKWQEGDVIATAEGKPVRHTGDLCSVLRWHRSGDKITSRGWACTRATRRARIYDSYKTSSSIP